MSGLTVYLLEGKSLNVNSVGPLSFETSAATDETKTPVLLHSLNERGEIMKLNRRLVCSLVALMLTLSVVAFAQVNRPYRNGSVWGIGFIRMKPGMEYGLSELHRR